MKKTLAALLALFIIPASSQAAVIYEGVESEIITKGVTYQSLDRLTESGWTKADILTVDLTDPNASLRVMTSPNGSSRLSNVRTMAQSYGAKAAVNADFFNFPSSSGAETNMLGMVWQDGKIVSTPAKDGLPSFVITEENKVVFDYFTFSGTLIADHTSLCEYSSIELYQINKVPLTTGAVTMITPSWGSEVTVPSDCYALIAEPTDEENKYKMINASWGSEKVAIPEGGAVFIANYSINGFLTANFAVGDVIEVAFSLSPDIDAIKEASGGNTIIVKDGAVYPFTSEIVGRAQRTALGLDKSGETLYIVTVDGREDDCPGMTQKELANFMISLGCDSAINLDGGGSTTMVAHNRISGSLDVKNSVSSLRSVSTGLGVFSDSPAGEAYGASVSSSADTIILGGSVEVYCAIYDENYNNVYVDPNDITYSCSDPYAIISGNKITPTIDGVHTITVSYGEASADISVNVIKDIFAINLYPEVMSGKSDTYLTVTAYDKNGLSAYIDPSLVTFTTTGGVVMEKNIVKAGSGKGTVTVTYDRLSATSVVGGAKHERTLDVREDDTFEGQISGAQSITVAGKISPVRMMGLFAANRALFSLSHKEDVYALYEFSDGSGILPMYRLANGFTERTIENTKIVTFANTTSSSFRKTDPSAWEKFKYVSETATEKNIIVMINSPLYSVNSDEQTVFRAFLENLRKRGKNVFVVSTGEKSEVTVEDGVRYIYLGTIGDGTTASFEYDSAVNKFVTFTFSGDEVKYQFTD